MKLHYQINFLSCQETQIVDGSSIDLKQFWDDSLFGYVVGDANGKSGGLFCMWNPSIFKVDEIIQSDNFILVAGNWGIDNTKVFLVNVYAPIDNSDRKDLWSSLLLLKNSRSTGAWLFMGDFNEVTCSSDRFSEQVCASSMNDFIAFIRDAGLTEFSMGGGASLG